MPEENSFKKMLGKDYIKVKLSLLWLFVMLNYIYADIMTLMDSTVLSEILTGTVGGVEISQSFLFWGALLMEIPIIMILLSLVLKYKWNRITNIAAGVIKTLAVGASLFVGIPAMYYLFFAVIEIAVTAWIVVIAWRWKK